MSIDQTKAAITGRIWQSIAQSGVQLSAIPQEELNTLVNAIADGMLVAVNELMGEQVAAQVATVPDAEQPTPGTEEQILWEGRPFLALNERYVVTSERIRVIRGLFARDIEDIELFRLQDVDFTQRMTERMFNIGDITIRSADASHPEVVLRNVTSPDDVNEIIRRAMLEARKRHRVGFREEI